MRKALVLGAGGFIGGHLVKKLKSNGYWVRAVDIKQHEYSVSLADELILGDLRDRHFVDGIFDLNFTEVYQLAADMGGAGFIFTRENDANIMHNSALINLHVLEACRLNAPRLIFYSSSACIYPEFNQIDPQSPVCAEDSAYPAQPDSEYGWEKLFSERLYMAYARNFGINIRIARFHNIFGPEGTWEGGREKAPAAICRKVALATNGGDIEVWGSGFQTRSFLYIDECLEGIARLVRSDFSSPVNLGSSEMVSVNTLVDMTMEIAGKKLNKVYVDGPVGVMGRCSDNALIASRLNWAPSQNLQLGLEKTYKWISEQISRKLVNIK